MRFLVVGLGSIGERHVRNLLSLGVGSIGVVRTSNRPPRTLSGKEYTSFYSLAEALESQPDAVIVANPTVLHVPVALQAVKGGAHVLIEIPLSNQLDGVRELEQEVRHRARLVLMGHNLRFHPCLKRMKEIVEGGALGRPLSLRADFGQYLPDCHPWADYRLRYEARKDLGGGVLLTSIHEVDHALWVLGDVTSVAALIDKVSDLDMDVEDLAVVILKHTSGSISNIQLDYLAHPYSRSCQMLCTEGTLIWDFLANRLLSYSVKLNRWQEEVHLPGFDFNDTYIEELKHFIKCVDGEAEPLNDLSQGIRILEIALAAYAAGRQRRYIDVPRGRGLI